MHEFTASIFKAFKAFQLKSFSALDLSMGLAAGRFCVVACQLPSPTQWNSTNCKCTLLQAYTAHCHSGHAHVPWPHPPTAECGILYLNTHIFLSGCLQSLKRWQARARSRDPCCVSAKKKKTVWRDLVPQLHICQELQQSLDGASINENGLAREHSVKLCLPVGFDLTCWKWPHCHVRLCNAAEDQKASRQKEE